MFSLIGSDHLFPRNKFAVRRSYSSSVGAVRVVNIDGLANIKRRDGQPEGCGASERGVGNLSKLKRCVRSSYRELPIFSINLAHKGSYEQPEESQRQRVTNEIEKDESPAESTHVANETYQIALGQVMAEVHGKCYIGKRQRIAYCVGFDYRN